MPTLPKNPFHVNPVAAQPLAAAQRRPAEVLVAGSRLAFIQAQIKKLEASYQDGRIDWGKTEQSDENKQKVFNSIAETRGILTALLETVDSNESLAREKAKILEAIELVFDEQGTSLRKDLKLYPIHPLQAALNFIQKFGITDPELILSAILHDTIEDVARFNENPSLIGEMFSIGVQTKVQSVTNQELPAETKAWLEGLGVSGEVIKAVEYQLGVAKEITDNPSTLLLKSADFSDNALKLGNLSGNPKLQARLSAKYGVLIRYFAEEFRKLADREAQRGDAANKVLEAELRATADEYEAAEEEVSNWAQEWEFYRPLNDAMRAIAQAVQVPATSSSSEILREIVRTRLGDSERSGSRLALREDEKAQVKETQHIPTLRALRALSQKRDFALGIAKRVFQGDTSLISAIDQAATPEAVEEILKKRANREIGKLYSPYVKEAANEPLENLFRSIEHLRRELADIQGEARRLSPLTEKEQREIEEFSDVSTARNETIKLGEITGWRREFLRLASRYFPDDAELITALGQITAESTEGQDGGLDILYRRAIQELQELGVGDDQSYERPSSGGDQRREEYKSIPIAVLLEDIESVRDTAERLKKELLDADSPPSAPSHPRSSRSTDEPVFERVTSDGRHIEFGRYERWRDSDGSVSREYVTGSESRETDAQFWRDFDRFDGGRLAQSLKVPVDFSASKKDTPFGSFYMAPLLLEEDQRDRIGALFNARIPLSSQLLGGQYYLVGEKADHAQWLIKADVVNVNSLPEGSLKQEALQAIQNVQGQVDAVRQSPQYKKQGAFALPADPGKFLIIQMQTNPASYQNPQKIQADFLRLMDLLGAHYGQNALYNPIETYSFPPAIAQFGLTKATKEGEPDIFEAVSSGSRFAAMKTVERSAAPGVVADRFRSTGMVFKRQVPARGENPLVAAIERIKTENQSALDALTASLLKQRQAELKESPNGVGIAVSLDEVRPAVFRLVPIIQKSAVIGGKLVHAPTGAILSDITNLSDTLQRVQTQERQGRAQTDGLSAAGLTTLRNVERVSAEVGMGSAAVLKEPWGFKISLAELSRAYPDEAEFEAQAIFAIQDIVAANVILGKGTFFLTGLNQERRAVAARLAGGLTYIQFEEQLAEYKGPIVEIADPSEIAGRQADGRTIRSLVRVGRGIPNWYGGILLGGALASAYKFDGEKLNKQNVNASDLSDQAVGYARSRSADPRAFETQGFSNVVEGFETNLQIVSVYSLLPTLEKIAVGAMVQAARLALKNILSAA